MRRLRGEEKTEFTGWPPGRRDVVFMKLRATMVLLVLGGCARQAGSQAAAGAIDTIHDQAMAGVPPGERPVAVVTGRAVDSAMAHLGQPRQMAIVRELAGAAARSAANGALLRVFPECSAEDAGCLDRQVAELGHQAAAGFVEGLKEHLGLAALVLAFLGGAIVSILVVLIAPLIARALRRPRTAGPRSPETGQVQPSTP
jgi:hypothetical protein